MAVTCTKVCIFYINDIEKSRATYTEGGLTPGLSYTPGHSSHMPPYDSSLYTSYRITYNGSTVTGSITCPKSNFTVYYYFYGYKEPSVAYWTWDDQNYSDGANAIFVRAARDAVNQRNKCSLFRHTVWNDLVRKTKEMREAKGESPAWNARYATEEETKMGPAEEDRKLTSKKFNSLRYNIGLVESTGITEDMCAPGEPVKGEYFMTLTAALNRAIEKYT